MAWLSVAVWAFLSGCGVSYSGPDIGTLRETVAAHGSELAELEAMLARDYPSCLEHSPQSVHEPLATIAIGHDSFCDVARREESLAADLNRVGLTSQRYGRYLDLLDTFDAETAIFAVDESGERYVELRIGSWGTTTSSRTLWIARYKRPPYRLVDELSPSGQGNHCSALGGDWYACRFSA